MLQAAVSTLATLLTRMEENRDLHQIRGERGLCAFSISDKGVTEEPGNGNEVVIVRQRGKED